jgi:protein-S-isoprenylcysteine O-methyltransferase Ste14
MRQEDNMIAWINLAVIILSSLLFLYFYVRSVSPAAREKVTGADAYRQSARDRVIAIVFEMVTVAGYIIYDFYPLSVPLPVDFPWAYWVSALIAAIIGVPALLLMGWGLKDAGEEAVQPKKEHTMYGGIYEKVRHPQALGEVFIWWVIAFLLNSPFLVLLSFIFVPIFLIMCIAEENDLLLRYGDAYADYVRRTGAFIPKRKRG